MICYQENDGGRYAAGYRLLSADCLVRAIAIVSGVPYKQVQNTVLDTMERNGYARSSDANCIKYSNFPVREGQVSATEAQSQVLRVYGFRRVSFEDGRGLTYTEAHQTYGTCIAQTDTHFAALKDGALQDTYDNRVYRDSGRERTVGSAWVLTND